MGHRVEVREGVAVIVGCGDDLMREDQTRGRFVCKGCGEGFSTDGVLQMIADAETALTKLRQVMLEMKAHRRD